MANEFGDFASLVPSKGGSESSQDFGDFASLIPETRGLSPVSETGGGAALMYPTAKRKQLAEGEGTTPTKVAEAVFGKGSAEDAPVEERVKKIGETTAVTGLGAMGLKALAPSMISGGEAMVARAPGLPLKALGGALAAGGALAERMGPREMMAAAGTAGTTQSAEEILNMAGVPREFQVIGSMGAGGLAQLAMEYPEMVANYLVKGVRGAVPSLIRSLGIEMQSTAEASASKLRKQAIDTAKQDLLSGASPEASQKLDSALKGGIEERQKAMIAEKLLQQTAEKSRIEELQRQQARQATIAQKTLPAKTGEEQLGSQIQGEIFSTQKPIVEQRATQYKSLLDDAFTSARSKQEQGQFWQTSEGGQAVKDYWQGRIDKGEFTKSQESEIKGILDDIYSGGKDGGPKDINAVDSWIRVLGDKSSYGLEPEGAKALSSAQAREIRRTLTEGIGERGKEVGGIYSWEPKFGQAKGLYSEKSDLLKAWDTKTGKKVLSEETKGIDVPKQFFTSREGYQDLVKQLGGDAQKAEQYASQYAATKIEGKTPEQTTKWLNEAKNGWVDEVPGLRQQIEQKTRAGATSERLAKEIPDLQKQQKVWSENVDKTAQKLYTDVMGDEKPGFAIERILSGTKVSDTEKKALRTYIGANPEARKLVPDVVRNILSKESPKTVLETFDRRIAPLLFDTKLVTKQESDAIRQQAIKIYQADAKDYSIPDNKKTLKAINFLYGALASKVGSSVTPTPQGEQ
jgi:hypothetical protein